MRVGSLTVLMVVLVVVVAAMPCVGCLVLNGVLGRSVSCVVWHFIREYVEAICSGAAEANHAIVPFRTFGRPACVGLLHCPSYCRNPRNRLTAGRWWVHLRCGLLSVVLLLVDSLLGDWVACYV